VDQVQLFLMVHGVYIQMSWILLTGD